MLKKTIKIILILIILQLSRILFNYFIFILLDKTLITTLIIKSVFMILVSIFFLLNAKKANIDLKILPKSFNYKYIVFTILLIIFMSITLCIKKEDFAYNLLSLITNAIILVMFEEIIFRGFIYEEISKIKNSLIAYIISIILFGIWHLGYIDSVLWRTSLFFSDASIIKIMFWKVITGFILGLILGIFRYKNKNVYSSMLIHSFINTFGS